MTIVEIINQALDELQLPNITSIETTTDSNAITFRALATKMANDISTAHPWRKLTKFLSITIPAGAQTYDLSLIDDFDNVESLYLWDTQSNYTIRQASYDKLLFNKVNNYTDVYKQFAFTEDLITFSSPFTVETELYLYYLSNSTVRSLFVTQTPSSDDPLYTFGRRFTKDTDTFMLEDFLLVQAIVSEFKKKSQLEGWKIEVQTYQDMLDRDKDKDSKNFVIDFANPNRGIRNQDSGYLFK